MHFRNSIVYSVFLKCDIPFITYIAISYALLILSYTIVGPSKYNLKTRITISIALLVNLGIYLYYKSPDYTPTWDKTDIAYIIYIAFLVLTPLFTYDKTRKEKKQCIKDHLLFKEREKDLELINNFLDNDHEFVLGINAIWGDGKSFLINNLKKIRPEFDFLTVDLLSSTIDTIEQYVLSEFNKLFERKKFIPKFQLH